MDINAILHFIPAQIEKIIGILAALFILTTIWLLIRSLKDNSKNNSDDNSSVEEALRRVLSQTTLNTRASSLDEYAAPRSREGTLGESSTDKDQQISELKSALEQAQILLSQGHSSEGAATESSLTDGGAGDSELTAQLKELKARLAEYEIIEDDIADLAVYREENSRLKAELEQLKTSPSATSKAVQSPEVALTEPQPEVAAQPTEMTEPVIDMSEPKPVAAASAPAEAEVDGILDPLADPLDPDKLIEEINAFESEDLMSEFKAPPEEKKSE